MSLEVKYDPESDAVLLMSGKRITATVDLESTAFVMIDLADRVSYEPVTLDLLNVSGHLPLDENERYHKETDTLTFGEDAETATLITENGDLVAYWRPNEYDPKRLWAIAVDLRNASKYLSSKMSS